MNKNKKDRPFEFLDSFILAIGYIRYSFRLPYRQTEGLINVTGKRLPSKPSYGQICKRINRLSVNIHNGCVKKYDDDEYIIIAADNTDIKVTNRGQWMQDKWKVKNKKKRKKCYLKIHFAVNKKTKEILALEVTDEKRHDSKMLEKLIVGGGTMNNIVTINRKIKPVLADGAYDSNENFRFLK